MRCFVIIFALTTSYHQRDHVSFDLESWTNSKVHLGIRNTIMVRRDGYIAIQEDPTLVREVLYKKVRDR